ncbi:MAG: J domain-containing protein, partial [Bdellovibrionales bacterium]|nr:J domain-containing protein [Bdellovibrionales bacterium]
LQVMDLGLEELIKLEILIRKQLIGRQESYELGEWKKAHRKAAKSLHPDHNPDGSVDFILVHEAFKALRPIFRPLA